MEALSENIGVVTKVEETIRENDKKEKYAQRVCTVEMPGPESKEWDKDHIRIVSDDLKLGSHVRVISVPIAPLTPVEVAQVESPGSDIPY